MSFLTTVLAFIGSMGTLVVLHELGHYLVARACNVKVLRFSVGMGKVVWSRRFGPDQTEWAISALPLGGYVEMLDARGQDVSALTPEELKREFTRQNVWARIAIAAAGPVANFLVAILLYTGLYMHGVAEPSSKVAVAAGSAAYAAGLRGADVVTAINGHEVEVWSDVRWQVIQAAVDRVDARIAVRHAAGGQASVVLPAAVLTALDLDSDVLEKLGIDVARPPPTLNQVLPGGAAARAGLLAGDLMVSVDGKAIVDGIDFITAIRASAGKTVTIGLRRAGRYLELPVTPETDTAKSLDGKGTVTVGKISVYPALAPDMIDVASAPFSAVAKAAGKVWDTSALTLKMIGKMIVGQASLKNITGPITIADYAGQAAHVGWVPYLSFVAFISISLGVMNLLPIPVLDGGHLLYYSLEVLTGRPVPERFAEMSRRLGVGLLAALIVLALFNDVTRLL
ncbi:RIP metalloprotease RseP [Rugamonas sp.]|uniref:RIP metalloprotease RseP n=1 Tax=Rugamonas sp. TaxID=1926287 RepID=UPI0025D9DD3C|nr:RIP metalloprotease RseP [Rugamonas sp.]